MADFITGILSKINAGAPVTVGVSVSQSGLLEVCKYDKVTGIIEAYANRTIRYNQQNREVTDIEEFKSNLLSIYQELDIPTNCSAVLSLPSVFFDMTTVPLILDTFATESVLYGEVEQSFIFKKNEPVISWKEIGQNDRNENKTIVYAAIQKDEMNTFVDAFNSIGTRLIAIDNSYYNLLNAIPYTQIAKHEIETNAPWDVILVTNNSYIICSMNGNKLVEYYEEPLALRNIGSTEEKYSTIAKSLNTTITNYVANSFLLISDSDDIDASVLCDQITFHGQKNYLNQNQYSSGRIIETAPSIAFSYVSSISLYALGSAVYTMIDENKKLNLMGNVKPITEVDTYEINVCGVELTKDLVRIAAILLVVIVVAFYGLIWFTAVSKNKAIESKIADIETKKNNLTQQLKEMKDQQGTGKTEKTFNMFDAKNDIVETNKKEIIYYNLLSFNIPRSTWLTHFYTDAQGAVSIEGKTSSTNNVYLFFKGIKTSVEDSDLALTKLKYSTGFEDEIPFTKRLLYDFELSNALYATSDKAKATPTPPTSSDLNDVLEQAKDISNKNDNDSKNSKTSKEKAPDLPPIEDIKSPSKADKTKSTAANNEKITKEDVDNVKKSKSSSGSSSKSKSDASLPDLPDLGD